MMTTMQPIDFPGLSSFTFRQHQLYKRYGLTDEVETEGRPVLAGLATKYNAPFLKDGIVQMFAPRAFARSIAAGHPIELRLDHESSNTVAHQLELHETDEGLFFRLDLDRVKNASILARLVETGSRACASVAYRPIAAHTEFYGGYPVRLISQASLIEVSACRRGAVARAFCFLTDDVVTPNVRDLDGSLMFALESANHRVKNANRAINEHVDNLTARVDRLCEAAALSPRMSFTAHCPIVDRPTVQFHQAY